MALTDENMVMPVAPYGGGNNGIFGDSGWWILILFLLLGNGGRWNGNGVNGDLYPWLNNSQNINGGFRDQMLGTQIASIGDKIVSGFGDVQTALCGGFAGTTAAVNGAQSALSQQLYTNQIADLERSFAAQTASTQGMTALQAQMAQCCCDNRAATADLKYTVASEACADRAAASANTQAILDKLCQLELDGYKRENDSLRTQLTNAQFAASQAAQTATFQQGLTGEVDALYNRLSSCPVPTVPVYGRQPIFTCGGNACGA